ncbi:MAG: NF038143 family protein [Proteobacteria bacterium]|nr:hypothetical protein [Desulfobacula sp.]MBU3951867.1 NF038143 family protein [Pseudomonadota bacterium]MBU4132664.1 NF038143 family protein [Pseudomonadota bacterium]
MDLTQKKEIILQHERMLSETIGSAVLEKPKVSTWMIFIPILFLFFIYRMKKFKKDRVKFVEDLMTVRRAAMDKAFDGAEQGGPSLEGVPQIPDLPEPLRKPYASWIQTLSNHYLDLLTAEGDDFGSLVCAAYRNRKNYRVVIDRLSMAEKGFYTALKPYLDSVEGAFDIAAKIESESRRLRSETGRTIFC